MPYDMPVQFTSVALKILALELELSESPFWASIELSRVREASQTKSDLEIKARSLTSQKSFS